MDFIDQLEKFLLKPIVKVAQNDSEDGSKLFSLGCYRRSKYDFNILDNEQKKDAIVSLIKKLRDNSYTDPKYVNFYLNLDKSEYINNILKAEPTNEDLFNLYKITGYGKGNNLEILLTIIKDKNWKLIFFKYGHDYSADWRGISLFRNFTNCLKDLNLNDDEWIDALGQHINNSIEIKTEKNFKKVMEICTQSIKDNNKCKQFIKNFFNANVELPNLFIQNKVNKLQINSKNIIRYFDYLSESKVDTAFGALYELIKFNLKDINHTTKIDYYREYTEHNFLIYEDNEGKGIEVVKLLINEMMPILKDYELSSKEVMQQLNTYFVKKLSYINLSMNMETNKIKVKAKIVKL
jgi:hypothetical protein